MRPQIDFLDTNGLDWINPRPGIYSRPLSLDPDTGARTALSRVVPADGYVDQPTAHSHNNANEEILIVRGALSFDSRVWLHAGGYVYHPAGWVHGFKSTVPAETWFIGRTSDALTFTYYDTPTDDYPYPIDGQTSDRPLAIVPSPWAQPWTPVASATDSAIREFEYGRDTADGARTTLRRYASGAADPADAAPLERCEEFFVLEGRLVDQSGRSFGPGCYACRQPGGARPRFEALEDSVLAHFTNARA